MALLVLGVAIAPGATKGIIRLVPQSVQVAALAPQDGLMAIFITGLLLSLMAYFPIAVASIYLYIKPALHEQEVRFAHDTMLLSFILFFAGMGFGVFSYLSFGIPFFIWANGLLGIANYWSVYGFVSQFLMAALCVGIGFLFPVILNNLIRFGIIKVEDLRKNRGWFMFLLAVVIIVVPFLPNNPLEQAAMFLPIYGMFEAVIFFNSRKHQVQVKEAVAA